ncbi:MAG TPA: phage tail tape measure protein, partial [Lacipirellulaceae bacterium]|nr:phage tail tape measure protein [Lacipirellulaceae bacterium]
MPTIDEMLVTIDATTEKLRQELARGDQQLGDFESSVNNKLSKIDQYVAGFGASFAELIPVLTAGGVLEAIDGMVTGLASLQNEANAVGMSAEQIQIFRAAAKDAGVETEQADQALRHFTDQVAQARDGTGQLKKILDEYNISLTDANGNNKSAVDIMGNIADAIAGAADSTDQLGIASAAFGQRAGEMVNIFKQGNAGLIEYGQHLRDSGELIDNKIVAKGKEFDDAWSHAILNVKALTVDMVSSLADGLDLMIRSSTTYQMYAYARAKITPTPTQGDIPDSLLHPTIKTPVSPYTSGGMPFPPQLPDRRVKQDITDETKAREDAARAAEEQQKKVDDVIASLNMEGEKLTENDRQYQLDNALKRANVDLLSQQGQAIAKAVNDYEDLKDATEQSKLETAAFSGVVDDLQGSFKNLHTVAIHVLDDILKSMENLSSGGSVTSSLGGLIAKTVFGSFFSGGVDLPGMST